MPVTVLPVCLRDVAAGRSTARVVLEVQATDAWPAHSGSEAKGGVDNGVLDRLASAAALCSDRFVGASCQTEKRLHWLGGEAPADLKATVEFGRHVPDDLATRVSHPVGHVLFTLVHKRATMQQSLMSHPQHLVTVRMNLVSKAR